MSSYRIALANLRFPATREESVEATVWAVGEAGRRGAAIICFPECYVPGYRAPGKKVAPPDAQFQEEAWSRVSEAAQAARVGVVLGTERVTSGGVTATALVIGPDGGRLGFQDKVQIDPSEEGLYVAGEGRRVFEIGGVTIGVAICHEGWRYPETVRFAARRGAKIVFHPHFHEAEEGGFAAETFADPRNSFHEKAMLCRAAENTCYFAGVNCASAGSPTTSAVVRPDGTLLCYQPYGVPGLLVAELDLAAATGLLASRCRTAVSASKI
ncbi:MAG: carbon-nitrogen hydrolase family protein [Bryobacteraceae bacterium]|nr:carbon-nitrogen hydrolase family protein [Bryobacteraceae bacterium]